MTKSAYPNQSNVVTNFSEQVNCIKVRYLRKKHHLSTTKVSLNLNPNYQWWLEQNP
jgi:hypothetical protein